MKIEGAHPIIQKHPALIFVGVWLLLLVLPVSLYFGVYVDCELLNGWGLGCERGRKNPTLFTFFLVYCVFVVWKRFFVLCGLKFK